MLAMDKFRLLVVEDDQTISLGLEYSLTEDGFAVTICHNATSALNRIVDEEFNLALLDISLPDGNGFDICRRLKERWKTPVIFLTARDDEGSVVMGLDIGADDYITKPFRLRELQSRIRSVLRRTHTTIEGRPVLHYGKLTVSLAEGKVSKNGTEVLLTALEYRLLLMLIHHEGHTLTRTRLLESVWDVSGDFVNDNTLTVYIKRLREKIEDDPQNPTIIKTVRGLGYQI